MNQPSQPPQPELRRTPLHDRHVAAGATMVPFAGWSMPVKYTSDVAEHAAVRTAAGLFDISHMGQLEVVGPDAAAFLDHALAGRFGTLAPLQSRYTMMLAPSGGIVDDLIVTNTELPGQAADGAAAGAAAAPPPTRFLVVANAGNRDAVLAELTARRTTAQRTFEVTVTDTGRALIAVQGPHAADVLRAVGPDHGTGDLVVNPQRAVGPDGAAITLDTLRYYRTVPALFRSAEVTLSRTGYTGEDGFELSIAAESAGELWDALLAVGSERARDGGPGHGLVPAGLAARDTLRLEAGMPLYGHELTLDTLPVQAGLGRVVATTKAEFVGRDAVLSGPPEGAPVLVGLTLPGRRAGRAEYPVLDGAGHRVGEVTSGVLSPTLGHPIAMAYVAAAHSAVGTELAVDVRGSAIPATVVALPFYRRSTEA